eukprot:NODE_10469_length_334_cov_25.224561_g9557_i0.p3 GENE.NODE_10469_length_334_cov_25.224561_g9557_i0~~NODE_10469_length_334_cov_25.224561_g9557_i0.p3  ORF type:complete len:62 (+),score=24.99 NODE_10469_length_334_cov_25.224561_g9557_i0:30-188(+)
MGGQEWVAIESTEMSDVCEAPRRTVSTHTVVHVKRLAVPRHPEDKDTKHHSS